MDYYVYFLSNKYRSTIYIGVTSNINLRLNNHKMGEGSSFTKKYNLKYLVYMEVYSSIREAIDREKQLKKWNRKKKEELIKRTHPNWLQEEFKL